MWPKILTVGSSKQVLHRLATDMFEFSIKNNIQLVPQWIPRIDNKMADLMSKQLDLDDYMLDPNLFAIADIRWGPHTVDRFSSFRTRQIPRFCSRWLDPFMEVLEAFSASWNNENNWLFPPPCIIPRVLRHLQASKADGTLVVPEWHSAPWWPLLTYDGVNFRPMVTDWLIVDPYPNMIVPAVSGVGLFGDSTPKFRFILLRLKFKEYNFQVKAW